MSIEERLQAEMKEAMRARQSLRVSCLRMLKSKIMEKTVAARAKEGRDYKLTEEEVLAVISGYAKQRRDSIEAYEQGGRDDLAEKERAELEIVCTYLPQQLTEAELHSLVQDAIAEAGAASPKDMGAVMKLVIPKVQGRADGKAVSQLVRNLLASGD